MYKLISLHTLQSGLITLFIAIFTTLSPYFETPIYTEYQLPLYDSYVNCKRMNEIVKT